MTGQGIDFKVSRTESNVLRTELTCRFLTNRKLTAKFIKHDKFYCKIFFILLKLQDLKYVEKAMHAQIIIDRTFVRFVSIKLRLSAFANHKKKEKKNQKSNGFNSKASVIYLS